MSQPFIGQIQMFGCNFAPRGWAFCNGQLLPISQNTALFSLLGTQYGGDGRTSFGLPNIQGRVPMSYGKGPGLTQRNIGQVFGVTQATLIATQMPQHTHGFTMTATSEDGDTAAPGPNVHLAALAGAYSAESADTTLSTPPLGNSGGNQPFPLEQPYLVVNYCIALVGIFPSRS